MADKKNGKILIVDDDKDVLVTASLLLKKHFEKIQIEADPKKIPALFSETNFDVLMLDMNFRREATSGREGMQWLAKARELSPTTAVIMVTAYGEVDLAVEALKKGASDFILKPWRNDRLLAAIQAALMRHQHPLDAPNDHFIGRSPAMKKVFEMIRRVAPTDANVLITGENGTGKELVAQALQHYSQRGLQPFISVDVGALSQSLFESELFGYVKGAFTDAKEDRPGKFEAANTGTLFLDEIGNIPIALQAKLLTVLQSRQVTRVGANRSIPIDVRLLCATNMDLVQAVRKNEFRQDLLYRINTVEIKLPALRDRPEDIPLLIEYYLKRYNTHYHKQFDMPTPSAIATLQRYEWPGNVRELSHTVERAVILADSGPLPLTEFLPVELPPADPNVSPGNLEELEKKAILRALQKHDGNISRAAQELGLTRAALYRRIEKYEIR